MAVLPSVFHVGVHRQPHHENNQALLEPRLKSVFVWIKLLRI